MSNTFVNRSNGRRGRTLSTDNQACNKMWLQPRLPTPDLLPLARLLVVLPHLRDDALLLVQRHEERQQDPQPQHDAPLGEGMLDAVAAQLIEHVEAEADQTEIQKRPHAQADAGEDAEQ